MVMARGQVTTLPMLTTAERALLVGLIDYAGVSPPALLEMPEAIEEYRSVRGSSRGWLLGRFVCPASRLEELARVLTQTMVVGERPWPISVVLDGDASVAAVAANTFDAEMSPASTVATVEVRLPEQACRLADAASAAAVMAPVVASAMSVSPGATPFFEVILSNVWEDAMPAAIAGLVIHREAERRPVGAKVRCGGSDAASVPSSRDIVAFLVACRDADMPFKATAGLHNAVRRRGDTGAIQHGFLNLLVAAALAEAGASHDTLLRVVEDDETDVFRFGASSLRWRDETVPIRSLQNLRAGRFASFGSCDLATPIDTLASMIGGDS